MKSFRLKVLVSALRAAGVVRDVPPLIAVHDRRIGLDAWRAPADLRTWIEGEPFQTVSFGSGKRQLRPLGRNTAEVLDFSMFLSPKLSPRLVVDGFDVGEVVDFSMVLAPDLRVQKYPFFVDTAVL